MEKEKRCPKCGRSEKVKNGFNRGKQRYLCKNCGCDMGKYFSHWIEMGKELGDKAPKIFNVNWFRTDKNGDFIWPGFGENLRVIDWILKRCENQVDAKKTPIGYVPFSKDINLDGLNLTISNLESILNIDSDLWKDEIQSIKAFYNKLGDTLPKELAENLNKIEKNYKNY